MLVNRGRLWVKIHGVRWMYCANDKHSFIILEFNDTKTVTQISFILTTEKSFLLKPVGHFKYQSE